MPAFIANFAAWREARNKERADRIIRAAAGDAKAFNARALWWNQVWVWASGLGPWPGLPARRAR